MEQFKAEHQQKMKILEKEMEVVEQRCQAILKEHEYTLRNTQKPINF